MEGLVLFNVALDGFGALLCLMMGVQTLASRRERRGATGRCFVLMCLSNAVMSTGDAANWLCVPPLGPLAYAADVAGSLAFYGAVVPVYVGFLCYIVAYADERAIRGVPCGRARRRGAMALGAVLAAYLVCCVTSPVTGALFSVTPEAGYVRGEFFWLSQVTVALMHVCATVLVARAFGGLTLVERLSFASYLVLPAVADAIQVVCYGVALLNASMSVALLVIFMGIQSQRRALLARREAELAQMRADIMLSQIQPHFLYNTLTAIRELCSSDPALAAETVTDFARYLRENMWSLTSRVPIAFERELAHARTYLDLERRRFGERLRVEYDIEAVGFEVPPLSLQPLVENAVRHGIAPLEGGGCVRICSRETERAFEVVVEDDGVGLAGEGRGPAADGRGLAAESRGRTDGDRVRTTEAQAREGVGIANVRSRVEEACAGTLVVEGRPGRGTRAVLTIPKNEMGGGAHDGEHHRGR